MTREHDAHPQAPNTLSEVEEAREADLPAGVSTRIVYLALDNSEHWNAAGAVEKNASIDRTERANAMLEAGATVYDAARVWSWMENPTLPDVLRRITKDTPLIISHWQCRDNPGYTVARFETDDYHVFVGGDAGSWSGSYGRKISIRELARYAEDTLSKHPELATLRASQEQDREASR